MSSRPVPTGTVWDRFVILPAHAQLKDLTINADKVFFDKENNRIEAEGSVEVTYKEIFFRGNHLIYNTSTETFFADRGFNLLYKGITFEGNSINYAIELESAEATSVKFSFQKLKLNGEKVRLKSDKIELINASFSTCDLLEPHYHVTASNVILYPDYGWLVSYWGFFWLGKFPVVPMPTYIYDFRAEEKARKNLPPFPDIGSNVEDGNYIYERLAWHLRRELSGTYVLSYAANKGVGGGVEADYIINEQNNGNVRIYGNFKDGFFGGVTHSLSFGNEVEPSEKVPLGFLLPRYHQYELETILSYRERLNYQKVSFLPNFSLRVRRGEIISKETKYDMTLTAGQVDEEGNTRLVEGGGDINLYGDFQETILGCLIPRLGINAFFYSNGDKWIKPTMGLDLAKNFGPDFLLELAYLHYFLIEGKSPFNYEMYHFRAADRLGSNLYLKIGETGAKIEASYYLDNWSPEDLDYSLFFKLHCYNLNVIYRSLRKEFTLGFSLASN